MTLHYHGTPITPRARLLELAGRNFCVSFAAPSDVETVHQIGQSVLLDNGAFTFWRQGGNREDWTPYYEWCEKWLAYPTTWAVIPDVIDGGAEANNKLLNEWPFGHRGAPVWHMDESLDRLEGLTQIHPKVCIGSAGAYAELRTSSWHRRMEAVFNMVWDHKPWLHMLRGMALSGGHYPFASVDSSDVAQNHHRPQNTALSMVQRWDAMQCPSTWEPREQMELAA